MKKLLALLLIAANVLLSHGQESFCDPALQDEVNSYVMKDGAEWLKDFTVETDVVQNTNNIPKPQYSMVLTANNIYRFLIKSSTKFNGRAKLTIFDDYNELKSTEYQSGEIPESLDIKIKETKLYHILVSFQGGKKGCAAFAVYFVKNQITP